MKLCSKLTRLGCAILLFTGLLACDDEINEAETSFSVNISAGILTKASNAKWDKGDAIGISMLSSGTNTVSDNILNHKYITIDGDGSFKPADSKDILLPDGGEYDFYGYYPYTETPDSFVVNADVSDQSNLAVIDLMTSDRFTKASKVSPNVRLQFKHRLSKLVFNFEFEELKTIKEFDIAGMLTKASYNILSQEFTFDTGSKDTLSITPTTTGIRQNAEVIVLPRAKGDGVAFIFKTSDDKEYKVNMENNLELESGKMYIFNVLLRKEVNVPVVSTAIIEDWGEGGEVNYETRPIVTAQTPGITKDFAVGDSITIFYENINNAPDHAGFKYEGGKIWAPGKILYWEEIGDGVSEKAALKASYIRKEKINETQMPEVFLADTLIKRFDAVHFNFKIAPSKVIVKLRSVGHPDSIFTENELKAATIILPDYITEYSLPNGVFTSGQGTGNITLKDSVALIVPQERKQNEQLAIITVNDNKYVIQANNDISFERGLVTRINVNVTKTSLSYVSASIKDWENSSTLELTPIMPSFNIEATTKFSANDSIVLYVKEKNNNIKKLTTYRFINNKWTYDNIICWEDLELASTYDFYAVSKLGKAPAGSNQMEDIMYADTLGVQKYYPIVLKFTKKTAKIKVELESKDGSFLDSELAKASITLPSFQTGAYFAKRHIIQVVQRLTSL